MHISRGLIVTMPVRRAQTQFGPIRVGETVTFRFPVVFDPHGDVVPYGSLDPYQVLEWNWLGRLAAADVQQIEHGVVRLRVRLRSLD